MSHNTMHGAALGVTGLMLAAACGGAGSAHAANAIQHWTQANGAQVWFMPSMGLPILDIEVDFDAGSRRDPQAQAGLERVTALMSQKGVRAAGGEPALDENQLGEAWADLGASFDAEVGSDRTVFRLRTLTRDGLAQRAVQLAARQMGQPAWPDDVWQRERTRLAAGIRDALTRPGPVAWRAYQEAVYGGHPYGYQTTPETLDAIHIADMQKRYGETIRACRAYVSVVGAVTREQADQLVTELLAHLPQDDCAALPAIPPVPALKAARQINIPFDSAQATVLFGQPGYARDDPDVFALLVGNHILGGSGLNSLLMEQVREKRGLTYGVSSSFSPGRDAGAFTVGLATRPDQAEQALKVSRSVVADFVANGPSADELKAAKENLAGGFPLRLDSNRKLLGNVANIAWNGLPLDYLQHWAERVNAVTADEIKAAFQRVLQPDRMVTVVLGAAPAADAAQPKAQ